MGLGLTGNRNLRFVFEFLMLACRLLEQCTDDGDRQLEIQGGAAVFDRVCAVTAILSTYFANSPPYAFAAGESSARCGISIECKMLWP